MGQMTSTALKNSSGTLLLQITVTPLRVERLGWLTGHERSNQQGEKPDLSQRKPGSPWENWLPTTSQLHGSCSAQYLSRKAMIFAQILQRNLASGKTRMVPKNKFTTVWYLASTSKNMPAMKCQILPIGNWLTTTGQIKRKQQFFMNLRPLDWKNHQNNQFAIFRKPLLSPTHWESHGIKGMHPQFGLK